MIYVATSSKEIERAERMIAALRSNGVPVTSTWPDNIRKVGAANPREASREDRAKWAMQCLNEVRAAKLLWLLYPTMPTAGAFIELGWAFSFALHPASSEETSHGPIGIVVSGDTKASIFPAICTEYETDEQALDGILAKFDRFKLDAARRAQKLAAI